MGSVSAASPRYVTIKTILERTGIHRQTVHYYLRKQLLPPPTRTSRTSALYHSATIELIQLVQALQKQQRLSLDEIVALFRQHRYDVRAIRQAASQPSFSPLHALLGDAPPALIPLSEIAERLTPPPPREWMEQVLASGVVKSSQRDGSVLLSVDALEALRAIWDGVRAGARLEQFRTLSQSIEKQAQQEFDQFLKNLQHLSATREAGPQVARLFNSLERFGEVRRRESLHHFFMQRVRQPGHLFLSPNRTYVFPSRTFLQKMGLFRQLDLLLRDLDRRPDDLEALRNLARACYVSSDWARLHAAAQSILRIAPNDPGAVANLGQALMFLGRVSEAVAFLEEALTRGDNPMAKIRLGQAIARQAYEAGDASALLDAVVRRTRLANEAIKESQSNPALHRKVRLNALLDSLYFSDPMGLNRPIEKEAQALYEEFNALPASKLPVLAKVSLAMSRLYATYALYLIRLQEGDPKASKLLKEIQRLDPDCVLAARGK
ncbi:MAG: MerR family transcriptional regulator [Bryobacteraceae bacterium]